MNPISSGIIGFFWLIFLGYWLISSIGIKKTIKGGWQQGMGLRIAIIIIIFILLRIPATRYFLLDNIHNIELENSLIEFIAVSLSALGIALAFWARVNIGRNWGQPMSIKENPELVTTGPYRYIRHPIYTGVMIAALGSVLGISIIWFIPFLAICVYFIYSAKKEEKNMTKEFPKEYPKYMKETKMFIPFLY